MLSVLLVEDDIDLALTIVEYLALDNITCDHCTNGVAAIELVAKNSYQVLLLDINLPKMNGLSVCQKLREQGQDLPVLMLTAKDSLQDKLAGFDAGTDDYLVKPFELEELCARIQVLAKRRSGQVKQLRCGDLSLDLNSKQGFYQQQLVKLTPTTFKLLEQLMRASPDPVSRQALSQSVWGEEQPDSNSLKVHMFHLRKQLSQVANKELVSTVTGFGFAIAPEE
ncbi:DNA-binding response regulator [Thalassotalea euphylliae]|uniref:DNA-binding response regulator n=1 Tax=Thalassotalea euphylliae TaxID=1655234 RepID=A0A3E0TUR4_9GAMM|nr:response regulator transcription factor [Thalassotalea euphylliae]REL28209.1 DNA-binding response regulator [Thalassotalea euphylliae]